MGGSRVATFVRERGNTEEWTGGSVYLAVPSLGRLPYMQWHPFSIGASVGDGSAFVVHASTCTRWTHGLTKLIAASMPLPAAKSDDDAEVPGLHRAAACDADEGEPDRLLQIRVIGPFPAPPALLECVSEVHAGRPLLLVGGGSGIVPLVAVLRRSEQSLPARRRRHRWVWVRRR